MSDFSFKTCLKNKINSKIVNTNYATDEKTSKFILFLIIV
jgi:hypothetical protein